MAGRVLMPTVLGIALTVGMMLAPTAARASRAQLAMFEEDVHLLSDPTGTLLTLRSLGVGVVRVVVHWSKIAPAPSSQTRPRGFDASDPAAYPTAAWAPYDAIVTQARRDGIAVDLLVTGGAPMWAVGPGPARDRLPQWRPSAVEYGRFFQAVATRYSGRYRPAGSASTLPAVRFWEIYNEPNFGQDLAPQATRGSSVSTSPGIYRALVSSAWQVLVRTGHKRDIILVGGMSPRGFKGPPSRRFPEGLPGYFSTTKPLQFVRTLYCVDSRYRELRRAGAAAVGCPTTAAGSRRFRSANPGLFDASGFAIHPYPYDMPPTKADSRDPDYVEFSELPRLAGTLDRLQRMYGSRRRLPIYNTEYGYITRPPRLGSRFLSPATAAAYMNWAEYISWRSPRIATTMQYLLEDPDPVVGAPEYGGFASGLEFWGGRLKPAYDAYRLPLFLPRTATRRGRSLEVWGCARPAGFARLDSGAAPRVQIQFQPGNRGPFTTLATVPITNPRGYFDTRLRFPSSGSVRLAWTYPGGDQQLPPSHADPSSPGTVHSRLVAVSVK